MFFRPRSDFKSLYTQETEVKSAKGKPCIGKEQNKTRDKVLGINN